MSTQNKNTRRRYYLHRVLKHKYGAVVKARKGFVCVAWQDANHPKVQELLNKYQYTIQTEIR
ncbi:hypothetical protein [Ornithobacterium rhinotracheale]|uniref:hypothetical protein n=1 Tax=Ornithobacterium rhinotracheale TaxID=28251 RepID=UPI001FF47D5A|nr:hypothetical protein [Ornithobacterium rhinotracheale]MCK0200282.1 hypothetical protein [Ornithobacterium rhinotracheale]